MRRSKAGDTLYNPVTRERGIVLESPWENPERRLVVELLLDAGAAVAGEHLHPSIHETFEVLEGELEYRLDGEEGRAGPGETIEIPAGSWHDWWHAGEAETVCRVTVSPGDRFEQMIRTVWGLGADGHTNEKGMPSFLQLMAIGDEFSDVIVFRKPPRAIQRAVAAVLVPVAHRRGYRGTYPRYEEMGPAGTPEQMRAGEVREPEFGPGAGPPG